MIHPSIVKKAEKLGLIGEDSPSQLALESNAYKHPPNTVQFHWPSKNVYAFGIGSKPAMEQMEAIMAIARMDPDWRVLNKATDPFMILLFNKDRSRVFIREGAIPTDTLAELNGDKGDRQWLATAVPTDGGEAFKQGFTAADCPYNDEGDEDNPSTEFANWNDQFDAAADAQSEADEAEEEPSGSVVKPEYRIRYAEAGHPNHCGDWLAETLNNLVLGKAATEIDKFEELCNANGVSLAKYKHEGPGWEGRLRMTGRNLLGPVLFSAGVMHIPLSLQERTDGQKVLPVPREWIETRNYKNRKPAPMPMPMPEPVADLHDQHQLAELAEQVVARDQTPVEQDIAALVAPTEGVPSVQEQLARRRASSKNKK